MGDMALPLVFVSCRPAGGFAQGSSMLGGLATTQLQFHNDSLARASKHTDLQQTVL
jgi:hypothetical protein